MADHEHKIREIADWLSVAASRGLVDSGRRDWSPPGMAGGAYFAAGTTDVSDLLADSDRYKGEAHVNGNGHDAYPFENGTVGAPRALQDLGNHHAGGPSGLEVAVAAAAAVGTAWVIWPWIWPHLKQHWKQGCLGLVGIALWLWMPGLNDIWPR